jgi:predicted  nucleic acid-binding Zn-ribbon protein
MKRLAGVALCLLLVAGCKSADSRIADLEKKNDALTERVKSLEDHLLEAQKKQVALQLALQDINGRLKSVETDMEKVRYAQSNR